MSTSDGPLLTLESPQNGSFQNIPIDGEIENDRLLPPALLQYWQTLQRWKFVLIAIVMICATIGIVVTLLTPPLYTSRAEIEITRQQKKVTNVQGLEATEEPQDLEFYSTQYALLKSKTLINRVATKLKLFSSEDFYKQNGKKIPNSMAERERLVNKLLFDNVSIDPIRSSRLIEISYTSRSSELSKKITDTWTHEFIGETTDREYESTAQARSFLENRLNALRAKLEESQQKAITYASDNNIVSLDTKSATDGKVETQRTLTASDLDQLNTDLIQARADRITAQSRVNSGKPDISIDALNNQSIGLIKEKRAEVAAEYAKVLVKYEPDYPTAKALKQQLDELDAAIARDTARFAAQRKQALIEAMARERDLKIQVDAAKLLFDKQNRATVQYGLYQRDANTNQQLYDGLLQRYKEIAGAGDVGASNISIVDSADLPFKPSSPRLFVNLALSIAIGICMAAAVVLGLEQIDEGIKSPLDVTNILKLPLIGNVPKINGLVMEALDDSKSILTESYLSIRSNLAFSTNHGLPRSIAVTSTQPDEGKSTTSVALATIIGRTGKSVILIDGDMRSPSIHALVDLPNVSGLSNLLAGDDDILGQVTETDKRGLSILPAGPLPPNPAELLSSDRLGFIISALLKNFDYLIIDSPPVLGLADAPLICRAVEGSVFVAEPGRSSLRGIRSALQRLKFVGVHLFGVIVTKIDLNHQQYGYSYGGGRYGYGYGYSYGSK
jgi:capsular exopolysaccharide synthesis family protein